MFIRDSVLGKICSTYMYSFLTTDIDADRYFRRACYIWEFACFGIY